jgi:hypothetical protein
LPLSHHARSRRVRSMTFWQRCPDGYMTEDLFAPLQQGKAQLEVRV